MGLSATRLIWLVMFFSLGTPGSYADSLPTNWRVVEASGEVHIKTASGRVLNTQAGTSLEPPFSILTGPNGRLVITHGQDKLTVSPDAKLTIPAPTGAALVTRIQQTLGSILYDVQHRFTERFEVDTPYLVSVVKGTTFNIQVTSEASTVMLIEGKLQVLTRDKKLEVILQPGQAATKSKQNKEIIVSDQQSLSGLKPGPIIILKGGESPLTAESDISANTIAGSGNGAEGPAKTPGPSTNPAMGDSGWKAETEVSDVPAGPSIGGDSVWNIDANSGGVSGDKIISGGSAWNAAVGVPFPTSVTGVVGNTLTIITPKSASSIKNSSIKKKPPKGPK